MRSGSTSRQVRPAELPHGLARRACGSTAGVSRRVGSEGAVARHEHDNGSVIGDRRRWQSLRQVRHTSRPARVKQLARRDRWRPTYASTSKRAPFLSTAFGGRALEEPVEGPEAVDREAKSGLEGFLHVSLPPMQKAACLSAVCSLRVESLREWSTQQSYVGREARGSQSACRKQVRDPDLRRSRMPRASLQYMRASSQAQRTVAIKLVDASSSNR